MQANRATTKQGLLLGSDGPWPRDRLQSEEVYRGCLQVQPSMKKESQPRSWYFGCMQYEEDGQEKTERVGFFASLMSSLHQGDVIRGKRIKKEMRAMVFLFPRKWDGCRKMSLG